MYEYDDGRLVRSRQESEWDDEQRGLMLALDELRRGECSGCGHPLAESTDAMHDANSPRRTAFYRVDEPVRCHACMALAVKHAQYEKVAYPQSLRFGARLVPTT